jgi:hypothetical protein
VSDVEEKTSSSEAMALARDAQSVDWWLQSLVSLANNSQIEFGITLNVEGLVVSGLLVSGRKYFELFAQEFATSLPCDSEETEDYIREKFAGNADIYDTDAEDPPNFIHLTNCRFFGQGGLIPSNKGVLWRGKIETVSGFNLGVLQAN